MPLLAYVEHCLPAPDLASRIELARERGLALEVAHRPGTDWETVRASGLPIAAIQAHGLHEAHPLHPDSALREAGLAHVLATIDLAAELGASRVVAALGFGREVCAEPGEECRSFLRAAAEGARRKGVRVMLEPLSRLRAPAEAGPDAVALLLDEVGEADALGTLLDAGHLVDDGLEPARAIADWPHAIDAVQLRGPRGAPPAPAEAGIALAAALDRGVAVVSVEHRSAIQAEAFEELVDRLRALV